MKVTMLVEKEFDVTHVALNVAVRYEEEDMPNDYPFRNGDMWCPVIDVNTGKIRNWPGGTETLNLHMKVCDQGTYRVYAGDWEVFAIENDYVPGFIPGSYGDYIEMQITSNGLITNWPKDFAARLQDCIKSRQE